MPSTPSGSGSSRATGAWPTASTRLVALLGWPVRHSLSPVMHNAAFAASGQDLAYLCLPTPPEHLGHVLTTLADAGAAGANVTVPHKQAVHARCDRLTEEAELVGAVNTLLWTGDGMVGDNTDAAGLATSLVEDAGLSGEGLAVLLGTGGGARAAAVAAARLGFAVAVVGRRPDAARSVAVLAGRAGAPATEALDLAADDAVRDTVGRAALVVNATPLGMEGERLPDPFMQLHAPQVAYDLVYAPPETPFLAAARAGGVAAHNGLGMLVAQAAAAFRRWTGAEPPRAVMSAAATAALAGPGGAGR